MYCFSPNRFSWLGTSSRSCAVACSKDGKCTRPRNSFGSGCKNTTSRNLRVEKNYRFEKRLQKTQTFLGRYMIIGIGHYLSSEGKGRRILVVSKQNLTDSLKRLCSIQVTPLMGGQFFYGPTFILY